MCTQSSHKHCWGVRELMYVINQLCTSALLWVQCNECHLKDSVWCEKNESSIIVELRQLEKVSQPPPPACSLRVLSIYPSAYVTCTIHLNNDWMPSLPRYLPPQPLQVWKVYSLAAPLSPTRLCVLKPFTRTHAECQHKPRITSYYLFNYKTFDLFFILNESFLS